MSKRIVRTGAIAPDLAQVFGTIPELDASSRSNRLTDQIDQLRQKGFDQGYEAGFAEGNQTGYAAGEARGHTEALAIRSKERAAEAAQFAEDFQTLKHEFELAMRAWFRQAEQRMTDLACEVVRSLVAAELTIQPEAALSITREILSEVTTVESVRIRVNPAFRALLESHRTELLNCSQKLKNVTIDDDPSLEHGVVIETDIGVFDGQIETRIDLFEQEFKSA